MAKRASSSPSVGNSEAPAATGEMPSDTARAVLSLVLFIHLFVLVVCFSANLIPSLLQQRILDVFRPYAQLLNFDLDGTRYFLTHATIRDVDHRIEVLSADEDGSADHSWQNIARGKRGTQRYQRYQRLADTLSFFQEDDETTALLAEAVARSYVLQEGIPVAQLRCRRHSLQPWDTPPGVAAPPSDPDSPFYFNVVYRASIVTSPAGAIRVLKRAEASLEASPDRRAEGL